MLRDGKRSQLAQIKFLAAYAQTGANIAAACRVAGIARSCHYNWLKDDPSYPERFETAHAEACDAVEEEIKRRGQDGYDEPVVYRGAISRDEHGQPVLVRKYSDTLLMFRARALLPEKYRERPSSEGEDLSRQIVVIEDEGWYGNDAHRRQTARDQSAQGTGSAASDSALAGPL